VKTTNLWFAILFGCIGAALLALGIFMGVHGWHFIHTARHAAGKVVRQDYGCAHVQVSFVTAAGASIQYAQNGEVCLETGQAIDVLYDPAAPKATATVNSVGALWGGSIWTGILGVVFLASALAVAFGSRFVYIKPGRY
jgi:hypothetical protein